MNILFLIRNWPVAGGAETVTVTLANEFVKRGHSIFISYLTYNAIDEMPYSVDNGIKSVKLPSFNARDENSVKVFYCYLKNNNIDIIINQGCEADYCRVAIADLECKLITCWHLEVLPKFDNKKDKLKNFLCDYVHPLYIWHEKHWKMKIHQSNVDNSNKYVFLSPSFLKEYAFMSHHKYDDKLAALPNPLTYNINSDRIRNLRDKNKIVLFVGRMVEVHKRMSYILRTWQRICKNADYRDWKLVMVGDGEDLEQTKNLSYQLGLINISFEGFKKPNSYYEKASIFVMTSSSEGLGMTLLEAQQSAVVPVVMNSFSSVHDIIENNYNGMIVDNNDLESFASTLKNLMKDNKKREELAQNGFESSKHFSVSNIVDKWEMLFKGIK